MGRSKYRAIKVDCTQGGVAHRHASKHERDRCLVAHYRQQAGEIQDLHVAGTRFRLRWPLDVNGVHIANYVPDFVYMEADQLVLEDAKGVRTDVYRLKAKLVKALYGITVRET